MMKNKILVPVLSLVILLTLGTAAVYAQGGNPPTGGGNPPIGGGNPPIGGGTNPGRVTLENPFKVGGTLYDLIYFVVNNIILPIGGVLAVLAFIYSGFLYVMARGDTTAIKKAHNALLYTAIGTALLLGAWVFAGVIRNTVNNIIS